MLMKMEPKRAIEELHRIAQPLIMSTEICLSDLLSLASHAGHSADDVRFVMDAAEYEWCHVARSPTSKHAIVCFRNLPEDTVSVEKGFAGILKTS